MDEQCEDSSNKRSRCATESSTSSSSSYESSIEPSMPSAPDGGWGWVVVFASFLCHLLADGFAFSFGVLYKDFLVYFGESKSKTSWIGSLFFGVPMMFGPFASYLTSRYGCRKVTIGGGLITAAGFIISSFMESVEMLCLTFGCVAGFGLSLIYIPAIVVVAFYFERKRAFATGLAVCGSGIGTFAIAPLTEYVLEWYTWKGGMLIWAGLALNLVICGALFRPLKFTQEEKFQRALDTFDRLSRAKSNSRFSLQDDARHENGTSNCHGSVEKLQHLLQQPISHSVMQLPTYLKDNTGHFDAAKILNELRNNNTSIKQLLSEFMSSQSISECFDPNNSHLFSSEDTVQVAGNHPTQNLDQSKKEVIWRRQRTAHLRRKAKCIAALYEPMRRKDIFYRGNLLKRVPVSFRATSCPDLHLNVFPSDSSEDNRYSFSRVFRNIQKMLKEMVDMSVVKNSLFLLFTFSNFVLYFWYDVPYVFLVDKAIEDGIGEKPASMLMSVSGIVNTVGQVIYGFLGDRPGINVYVLYAVSIILCGVSITVIPFFTAYVPLAVISACFGLFVSANYSLCTILLVDFVGMNRLTNAYGLLMMNLGIANLIGPPVAGK